MSKHDRVVHILIGYFLRACLDHDNLLLGSRNGKLEAASLTLLGGRVHNEAVFLGHAHEHAADRSVPRNIGNGKGDGRTDHCGDLGRAVMIDRHNGEVEVYVVAQILREKRTDRAVDDAGGEDSLFGGASLTLEISAGDAADRIHSLFEIDGQREKIDAVAGTCGSGGAAKNRGVAVAHKAGAVCKSCELAGLDYERTSGKVRFKRLVIFKHTVLPFRFYFSQKEI